MEEGSGCKSLSFSETTRRDQLRDYRAHVTRLINGKLKYVRVIMFYLTFQGCTAANNGKSHPAQRPVLCSRGHPTFQFRAYFHSLNEPEFAEVSRVSGRKGNCAGMSGRVQLRISSERDAHPKTASGQGHMPSPTFARQLKSSEDAVLRTPSPVLSRLYKSPSSSASSTSKSHRLFPLFGRSRSPPNQNRHSSPDLLRTEINAIRADNSPVTLTPEALARRQALAQESQARLDAAMQAELHKSYHGSPGSEHWSQGGGSPSRAANRLVVVDGKLVAASEVAGRSPSPMPTRPWGASQASAPQSNLLPHETHTNDRVLVYLHRCLVLLRKCMAEILPLIAPRPRRRSIKRVQRGTQVAAPSTSISRAPRRAICARASPAVCSHAWLLPTMVHLRASKDAVRRSGAKPLDRKA